MEHPSGQLNAGVGPPSRHDSENSLIVNISPCLQDQAPASVLRDGNRNFASPGGPFAGDFSGSAFLNITNPIVALGALTG